MKARFQGFHRGPLLLLLALLAWTGCRPEAVRIRRLDDARQARIGVMTGTTGEAITRARFPQAVVKSFDDIMDAVAALQAGQLEAIVTAFPAALQVTKKNPGLGLLEEVLSHEDTAIALRKGDPALLARLNALIGELRRDGTLEDLRRRWFKRDLGPYEEPDLPLPAGGEPLRIGVSATREPFSFVDPDGRVTGHDGELARILGQRLRRPVEFLNMKFLALIPALQAGKVDLIITGMTATEERRRSVDFTEPYFANAQVMLVRTGAGTAPASGPLASLADLRGRRIGVLLGSAHDTYATRNFTGSTILQYQTPADVALAVKSGKADAALYDAEPLREILRQEPGLAILGDPLFTFPVAAGFRPDNTALRDQFNAFLADLRRQGIHQEMVTRWMERGGTRPVDLPHPAPNGVLRVGVSDVGLPFTALQDGRWVGFDIELCERFAAALGKSVQLSPLEFGSLIAALSSGKVDLIAASIYVTAERQEQVRFSDPYFEMGTRVFVLRSSLAGGSGAAGRPAGFLRRVADSFEANILREKRYRLIGDGLKTTLCISLGATLLGTGLGALVCWMRMSSNRVAGHAARLYIAVLRGTPVLVLLMLIFYVVFASVNVSPVLVAILAFALNFAAYSSEVFRSGIEGIDRGQMEAGIAMGFTRFGTFRFIILPQTVQRILPVYKGEFISLVKMTSIVGYIAVQDLTKAGDIIRSRTFDAFFPLVMVAVLYFGLSWALLQVLGLVERATDPRRRRSRRPASPTPPRPAP